MKRIIYLNISVHKYNIHIAYRIHSKTAHLQLLPAPLVVSTTGGSTCGLPLIGDIVLNIQHTVSVCASRVGPSDSQGQVLVQQHRVNNRPTIGGQFGQFTIIGLPVDKPQGIMPGRIGSWQPFKGMQAHTPCPPSRQGIPRAACAHTLNALKKGHHKRSISFLTTKIKAQSTATSNHCHVQTTTICRQCLMKIVHGSNR
jgi:hypothetical protein